MDREDKAGGVATKIELGGKTVGDGGRGDRTWVGPGEGGGGDSTLARGELTPTPVESGSAGSVSAAWRAGWRERLSSSASALAKAARC